MCWNAKLIVLILFTTVVSYTCAILTEKYPKKKKIWLVLTLFICLGVLFYFKYFAFFVNSVLSLVNAAFGSSFSFEMSVLLPVGISFYTFQTLSYVIDVYRGEIKAEKNFVYFALFVSFFPQLVAGPIESAKNLLPQLKEPKPLDKDDLRAGLRLLLTGFFRKCVIADNCGIYVNTVFANVADASGFAIAIAGLLFCVEMYCDFAGYSEIAQGAARLLGVRLMRNFDMPYLSVSYGEFFRRWHISLNKWFTSYVYIPLGGSRGSKLKRARNVFIVFALCGLWHGANWTYVLWGLYAAFWVSLESVILPPLYSFTKGKNIDLENAGIKLFRRIYMFIIFIPAALTFRSGSLFQLKEVFKGLFTRWSMNFSYFEETLTGTFGSTRELLKILLVLASAVFLTRIDKDDIPENEELPATGYAVMLLAIGISWVLLLKTNANSAFAYFQF
jgi:D-alanyl-lipoteichoic acid acyltransferase DltB (MBOAT superfamily)